MKKILILGDSITDFGHYVSMIRAFYLTNARFDEAEFFNLGVSSENTSGLAEEGHPFKPRPNILNRIDRVLDEVQPDIVVALYGINDGIYYPFDETIFAAFRSGMTKLTKILKSRGIYTMICTPPFFDTASVRSKLGSNRRECEQGALYEKYDEVMEKFSEFVRLEIGKIADKIIDVHGAMKTDVLSRRACNPKYVSGDGIHPNVTGNGVIAQTILNEGFGYGADFNVLLGDKRFRRILHNVFQRDILQHRYLKEKIGHENIYKDTVLPEEALTKRLAKYDCKIESILRLTVPRAKVSDWNGYERHTFAFRKYKASVIFPKEIRKGVNFLWKPEFLDAFPRADTEFLRRGFVLVHLDFPNLYGSPTAIRLMEDFYAFLRGYYMLSEKVVFIALSRGALAAVNFAADHPDKTSVLYLDSPVVDVESWPCGKGKGEGSPIDVRNLQKVYGLEDGDRAILSDARKMALGKLSEYGIPVIIVANDEDEIVPFEENGKLVQEAYTTTKKNFKLILKQAKGHHPHGLPDAAEICDWVEEKCGQVKKQL